MSFCSWFKGLFETTPDITGPAIIYDTSGWSNMYKSLVIRGEWSDRAEKTANKVLKGKDRYEIVSRETKVPWHVIGCIHSLEADCDFNSHLHNGDPLSARTVHVPSGRPKSGNPPFKWEDSAIDALAFDNIKGPMISIGSQLKAMEYFNGTGYIKRNVNSPYLWSGSTHYSQGKYVADGKWSDTAVSQQVGAAVIIKVLEKRGVL